MPRRTLEAVIAAMQAKKAAEQVHADIRKELTALVLWVVREVYNDDPTMAKRIEIHGHQIHLGERFGEVLERSQAICGIVVPANHIQSEFQARVDGDPSNPQKGVSKHALDVALAMNDYGDERVYDPAVHEILSRYHGSAYNNWTVLSSVAESEAIRRDLASYFGTEAGEAKVGETVAEVLASFVGGA